MSFARYPEYKDSGHDWLGTIPSHWSVIPLAKIASSPGSLFIDGDWVESKDLADEGIRYITTGNVGEGRYKEQGSGYISQAKFDELRCTEVLPGDVLISRLNLPIGRACVVPDLGERIITSVDNVITRPDDGFSCSYLAYMLSSASHFANMENLARGTTMLRISRSTLGQVRFAFPCPGEQEAIATFLDHETAKIDALVAEQEKLIALLQEKRQAVISHAVTKGLDPNVPMKDSGVEWLGKVPAHWHVMQLKRDIEFVTSGARGWAENYADEGDLFIRIGNLTRDSIRLDLSDTQRVVVPEGAEVDRTQVQVGDILFSITAYLGSVAVVPEGLGRAFVSQHVALVRPRKKHCLSEWSAYVAISYIGKTHLETAGYGGTKIQLSLADVANLPMVVPPIGEQALLVEFLDHETAKIDTLVDEQEKQITLLQERRTALISAVVTGQIDVRGWVPAGKASNFIASSAYPVSVKG